jgi:antitoxin (DNA-binding transcriptional repressor) of toxin-antitoxin stability system
MQSVTATELKNRTGAVLRLVRAGAAVAVLVDADTFVITLIARIARPGA